MVQRRRGVGVVGARYSGIVFPAIHCSRWQERTFVGRTPSALPSGLLGSYNGCLRTAAKSRGLEGFADVLRPSPDAIGRSKPERMAYLRACITISGWGLGARCPELCSARAECGQQRPRPCRRELSHWGVQGDWLGPGHRRSHPSRHRRSWLDQTDFPEQPCGSARLAPPALSRLLGRGMTAGRHRRRRHGPDRVRPLSLFGSSIASRLQGLPASRSAAHADVSLPPSCRHPRPLLVPTGTGAHATPWVELPGGGIDMRSLGRSWARRFGRRSRIVGAPSSKVRPTSNMPLYELHPSPAYFCYVRKLEIDEPDRDGF